MDRGVKRPAEWEDPIGNTKVRRLNSKSEPGRSQESTEIDQDIKSRYNSVFKGSPRYFTMIVCMILSVGTSVYRNVLKKAMSNIKNFEKALLPLEPRFNNYQKSILFPKEGTFSGDLNDLNMETMYIVLKGIGNFKPHSKGWGVLPEDNDHSTSANLDRIELIRAKTIGRCVNINIKESEFKTVCQILINAMIELDACFERLGDIFKNTYAEPPRMEQKQTRKSPYTNKSSRNENENLERDNYFRILHLTLDIGTRVLREEFESRFPKNRSYGQIFKIYKSELKPNLDKTSRKIIYPKEGEYSGNLRDLAIPTLYSLCRCAANIPPHDQEWGNPPNDDDCSLSASIERIRIIRNEIVSYPECKMDETDYLMKLRSLKQSLLELGAKEKDINDIIDISSDQKLRNKSKVDKLSDEQADESTQFLEKTSSQRTEWFFKLPIVCDGLVVDCIIDKRLENNYKSLQKIIKKRELSIMSGRPPGVCLQIFETEQIDMQRFIHSCEFLYDSLDSIRLLKNFTVLYLPSNVEFEKIFIFQKVQTSRKVNIKGELHNSIEGHQMVLCRYILINFNKTVMCPLLEEALDKAIKTKRRNTMKALTSQIIKYFFQIHEKVFDRRTSIWLGIECTCETSKDVSYEDCLYSSSKPKIIIERYPSLLKETFVDEMFYGFSIRIIETNSKEARFVAKQILQSSGTQFIEGNLSGKVAKDLFEKHSNLSIIYPSSMKSKGFKNTGSHNIENINCINLICTVKGVIPVGDTHFPLEIDGVETDVLEGATHLLGTLRIGDKVGKTNTEAAGTLGGFVKYYGLDTFLTCAHVVFGKDIVHSITKNKIHLENYHMMKDKTISEITECILIRHTFKNDDHNPSETSIDAALAVIKSGDFSTFNIANDDTRRQCCTDLVCNVHLEKIMVKNRSKNKSVRCAIPTLLSHHKKTAPRAERNITNDAMMKIHSSTGIVLAIGTPICSNCRKHLSSGKPDEHLEVSVPSEEISVETLSEIDYNKHLALNIDGEKREDKRHSSDSCTKLWNDHQKETVTDEESQTESESMCLETGDSQYSEASVCVMDKLQKLNSFLAISDVSPVKEKLLPLSSSTDKTKQRCLSKAVQCLSAVCETICPGEGDLLFKSVFSAHKPEKSSTPDQTALILKDIYISAETWSLRRQILSVLSRNYSFQEVREMIPDLTKYRFYAAKLHSDEVGCGLPVSKERLTRNKIDIAELEHFIDFIISSDVVKDLPFGMKTMKLSTGEIVAVPNLIRSLAPSSLINQFIQFCDSENVGHLGRSTMYKILNDCAASVRKCVEGLDYYIAEGGKAFQDLETIIEKLCISSEKKKELKSKLLNGKRYIKSDFKVHIQRENAVPDHCQVFALSDSEKCFSQSCNTQHKHCCEQCIDLADFLAEISTLTQNGTWDNKDSIVFQVENAVEAIKDWKSHAMRARNQEGAKQDLLKNLNENQALITCDWAMKFLPRKFREGQSDWFAKRGINWHISVTLYKQGEELKTITHVHIFSSQISQDGSVTASVLCDVVHDLTKQVPNIHEVNFFSDNAGCYKNTMMMVALKDELGDKLKTYNFSEAQDGKGPCDRRASHIKACVRRYINEGHDVTSAEEMKQAIDVKQKGSFRVRVVDIVTNLDAEKSQIKPITGITQLHNFSFDVDGITVWKAYGIGEGKRISWDNIGTTEQRTNLLVKVDWTITAPQLLEVEVMAQEEELIEPNPKKQKKNSINQPYDCPKDGCTRAFKTQCALEQHIIVGNCDYHNEKTTQDKAKSMYGQKVNSLFHGTRVQLDCNFNDCRTSESVKGWALKGKKKRTVFSQSQVNYMKEKFDIGKVSGRKVDPFQAADEMRQLQEEGKYVFSRKDYLTGQQITAYFSRLALKDRKTDLEDYRSAEEETNKRCLKQEILDSVSL